MHISFQLRTIQLGPREHTYIHRPRISLPRYTTPFHNELLCETLHHVMDLHDPSQKA